MSTYITVTKAIQEIEYWLRLATLLHEPMKESLLNVLHNKYNQTDYVGLPSNPVLLNTELKKHQNKINQLKGKKLLNKDQIELLLPTGSNQTDSSKFDITLIILLIIDFTNLPPPTNGWKKEPSPTDMSLGAFVLRARRWRNDLIHGDARGITPHDFNLRWTEGEVIIKGLLLVNYNTNILRTITLDVRNSTVLNALSFFSKKILGQLTAHDLELKDHENRLNTHDTTLADHDAILADHNTTLAKHDTALAGNNTTLADHDITLAKHDAALAKHDTTLADHDTTLANHDTTLTDHDTALAKYDTTLANHDTTLANHDTTLADHDTALADNDTKLADHDKALAKYDTALADYNTTLADHDTTLADHDTTLADHDTALANNVATLAKHGDQLNKQQFDLAGLDAKFEQQANNLADNKESLQDLTQKINENEIKFVQTIDRLEKEFNFIQAIPQEKNDQSLEPRGLCLAEVLEHILTNIGPQEDELLKRLGLENAEEDNVYELLKFVPWSRIKFHLERLERSDIVDYITANTLITEDIKLATTKLRCRYSEEVIISLANQSLSGSQETSYYNSNDMYTDLAVLKANVVDSEIDNSDRKALMEQRYFDKESIELDDLFQQKNDTVFVRGVGGMGKTTMLEMYTLKWAKKELELDLPLEFIFLFSCRELNRLTGRITSIEDLFTEKYPEIFSIVSLENLAQIADRVLIIIDGLDEVHGVYETEVSKNSPSLTSIQILSELINTQGPLLKGHKCIACGRPKACDFIKRKIHQMERHSTKVATNIKTVEVCGFSKANVEKYIEKFFAGNTEKANRVREAIKTSENLRVMASVPVFIWVIVNVYSEDLITKPLNTHTELYMYACLVFLRNHMHGVGTKDYKTLIELLEDNTIFEVVYSLMTLSVKTYMNNKVLFTEQDIKSLNCPIHLEQTGLIVKYSRGEIQEPIYQFKHIVLQEFLTGLFFCVTKGISPYLTNRELSSCSPIIFGILRLLEENDNKLFVEFFTRLTGVHRMKSSLFKRIQGTFQARTFQKFISRNTIEFPKCMIYFDSLVIDTTIPECQEFLTVFYEAKFKIECPFATVEIFGCPIGIEKRNIVFLIWYLNLELKLPNCMWSCSGLSLTTKPECNHFISLYYGNGDRIKVQNHFRKLTIDEPISNFNKEEILYLIEKLNLKSLEIPRYMFTSSRERTELTIDARNLQCYQFIEFVCENKLNVECDGFKMVELRGKFNEKSRRNAFFLMDQLELSLKIPESMILNDTLTMDDRVNHITFLDAFQHGRKISTHGLQGVIKAQIMPSFVSKHPLEPYAVLLHHLQILEIKVPPSMIYNRDSVIIDADSKKCMACLKLFTCLAKLTEKIRTIKESFPELKYANVRFDKIGDYDSVACFISKCGLLIRLPPTMTISSCVFFSDGERYNFDNFYNLLKYDGIQCALGGVTHFSVFDTEFEESWLQKLKFIVSKLRLDLELPHNFLKGKDVCIKSDRDQIRFFKIANILPSTIERPFNPKYASIYSLPPDTREVSTFIKYHNLTVKIPDQLLMADGILNLDFNLPLTTPFLKMIYEENLTLQNENLNHVKIIGETSIDVLNAVVSLITNLKLNILAPEKQFNDYGLFTIDITVPESFNFIYVVPRIQQNVDHLHFYVKHFCSEDEIVEEFLQHICYSCYYE